MRRLLAESTAQELIEMVCDLAAEHVDDGGIPFGALVADQRGAVLATGFNRVRQHHDPTAHAEIVAMRAAARQLEQPTLNGTTLFASGEPCAMCYIVARYAGIGHIVYAASRHDAARFGFDYRKSYQLLAVDPLDWEGLRIEQVCTDGAYKPFERFSAAR